MDIGGGWLLDNTGNLSPPPSMSSSLLPFPIRLASTPPSLHLHRDGVESEAAVAAAPPPFKKP